MTLNRSISVVIPLFNHGKYIDSALDSVLEQTVPAAEILVLDDGSQDDSLQRVQIRAARESKIKVWSRFNKGAHCTLNELLSKSTGDYISILNSDDIYDHTRLEKCINAVRNESAVNVVCSALSFIDSNARPRRNKWYEEALSFFRQSGDFAGSLINGNFLMTTSNLFIKREVFNSLGGFANLRYAHDLDFFLRIIASGRRILLLDEPLVQYRLHDHNTISEGALKVKVEWAAVAAYFIWQMSEERGWQYLAGLLKITDLHGLTPMVLFFFKYFKMIGPERVAVDVYRNDPDFESFLIGVVQ